MFTIPPGKGVGSRSSSTGVTMSETAENSSFRAPAREKVCASFRSPDAEWVGVVKSTEISDADTSPDGGRLCCDSPLSSRNTSLARTVALPCVSAGSARLWRSARECGDLDTSEICVERDVVRAQERGRHGEIEKE